tara:strand:- start:41 stop:292 length:252 start_codon:yes stop_codon:yes gene_type:complete
MTFNMKRGNKKRSYSDIFNESNQEITDVENAEREANIENQKIQNPIQYAQYVKMGMDMMGSMNKDKGGDEKKSDTEPKKSDWR